jgi:hypothetical protein
MTLPSPSLVIQAAIQIEPRIVARLSAAALQMIGRGVKTYGYFLSTLERLIQSVYDGNLGGEFIEVVQNLILGQISQAYEQAWQDDGDGLPVPEYLRDASQAMVLEQYEHVEGLYRDIVDARVDGTAAPVSRAALWAGQYDVAYREATQLIQMEGGGNFVWRKGNTERGCSTCAALDGIVASAREWDELDVHPRGYPNPKLECQGGGPVNNCDCTLEPTDQRRSPKAFDTILNIVSR